MKQYEQSKNNLPEPILLSQCPQTKIDLRGLMEYAKSVNKKVIELTEEERGKFIR